MYFCDQPCHIKLPDDAADAMNASDAATPWAGLVGRALNYSAALQRVRPNRNHAFMLWPAHKLQLTRKNALPGRL